jgi:hypothetical protein
MKFLDMDRFSRLGGNLDHSFMIVLLLLGCAALIGVYTVDKEATAKAGTESKQPMVGTWKALQGNGRLP